MEEKEFIQNWVLKVKKTLRKFPEGYISEFKCTSAALPVPHMVLGEELFGKVELTDLKGKSVLLLDDLPTAKYYLYSSHNNTAEISIPFSSSDIESSVKNYEKDLDSIIKNIETEYVKHFPKLKNFLSVSNEIFNSLNLKRY